MTSLHVGYSWARERDRRTRRQNQQQPPAKCMKCIVEQRLLVEPDHLELRPPIRRVLAPVVLQSDAPRGTESAGRHPRSARDACPREWICAGQTVIQAAVPDCSVNNCHYYPTNCLFQCSTFESAHNNSSGWARCQKGDCWHRDCPSIFTRPSLQQTEPSNGIVNSDRPGEGTE